MQLKVTKPWLLLVLLTFIVVLIAIVLFNGPIPNNNPPIQAKPSPAASQDAAMTAARGILAVADQKANMNAPLVMAHAVTAANARLGEKLFADSRLAGAQLLLVTVDGQRWDKLSDADRNVLFASLASAWAAVWQRNNAGKSLQNGAILRVQDRLGHALREDVYQKQG